MARKMIGVRNFFQQKHLILFAALFLLYAVLRLAATMSSMHALKSISDTTDYFRIAAFDIWNIKFIAGTRPFVYPFFIKIARGNEQTIALMQTAVSILCWGGLSLTIALQVRHWAVKTMGFVVVLLFSMGRFVSLWDTVLLTESLSLSLFALFLALWVWLLQKWNSSLAILLVVVSLGWVFVRDTNAWLVFAISVFTIVMGIVLRGRHWIILGSLLLVIFLAANSLSEYAVRWRYPFQNVLTERILSDDAAIQFFEKCGMPIDDQLVQLAGGNTDKNDQALSHEPLFADFRSWMYESGKGCYVRWLLSYPIRSLSEPGRNLDHLLIFENVDRFYSKAYQPILPAWLESILYFRLRGWLVYGIMLLMIYVSGIKMDFKQKPLWGVWVVMWLLVFPHLFLVWHGDTLGLDRHALTLVIQFFLSFWIGAILFLDGIIHGNKET